MTKTAKTNEFEAGQRDAARVAGRKIGGRDKQLAAWVESVVLEACGLKPTCDARRKKCKSHKR